MSNTVDMVMNVFNGLNKEEKKEVIIRIGEQAEDILGRKAFPEKASAPKSKGKRWKTTGKSPYWIKTVQGLNEGTDSRGKPYQGAFKIEGSFIKDLHKNCGADEVLLLGTRNPKQYRIAQWKGESSGKELSMHLDDVGEVIIKGLECIMTSDNIDEIIEHMKDNGPLESYK